MTEKYYISAQELLEDSYKLGVQIIESDFRPDFIVGVWRGGTPVGIAIQEMLEHFEISTDHMALRTSLYTGIQSVAKKVQVHGLDYLVKNLNAENALLIVDDVFDSGKSIEAVIQQLSTRTRRNTPQQIKVAAPWYKPGNNKTERIPDYYLHTTEQWLVFPHEIQGLSNEELKEGKSQLYDIIKNVKV